MNDARNEFNTPEGIEDARNTVANLAWVADVLNAGANTLKHDPFLSEGVGACLVVVASIAHTLNALADSREAEVIGASITRDDDGDIGYI